MDILIVEDQDGVRAIMAKLLTARGHRVIEAANGNEALEKARKAPLDLIITEIILAGRSGYQFLREIAPIKPTTRLMLIDRDNAGAAGVPEDVNALILPGDLKSRGYRWLASLLPD